MVVNSPFVTIIILALLAAAIDAAIDPTLYAKMDCVAAYNCKEVYFNSSGYNISAWLYVPDVASATNPSPAIVMANGYSLIKEQYGNTGSKFLRIV